MSLASDLMQGGSFNIGPSDVDDVVVFSAGRRGSYGPKKPLKGAMVSAVYITPSERGAPLMELYLSYKGKKYEVTSRLDYLERLRQGKLVTQFGGSAGGVKSLVVTLTPKKNAELQVWLDRLEETGHTLTAYS